MNLDLDDSQEVVVTFDGNARGSAERWLLSGDSPVANNELENLQPQASVAQDRINSFSSGYRATLPPHSMTALRWQTS